jgi:hypothetical protein|nr:MAG TPA: minor tail protein [Caudoviricetes sp.]
MSVVVEELQILVGCDASTAEKVLTELETRLNRFVKQSASSMQNAKAIRAQAAAEREALKTEAARVKYAAQMEEANARLAIAKQRLSKANKAAEETAKKEAAARADEIRWAKLAADAAEETAARIRAAAEDEAQARADANEAYAKRRALWEDNGGKSIAQAFREKDKNWIPSIDEAIQKMQQIQGETEGAGSKFDAFREKVGTIKEKFGETVTAFGGIKAKVGAVVSKIGGAVKKVFGKAVDAVKTKVKDITSGFSKMGKAVTKILSRMIIWRSINAMIMGTTEGMNNMVQASSKANAAMSQLQSGFTYVKNSIAAMLLPALQSILPVINKIIQAVAGLFNMLGALFAKFRGDSTFTKAVYVQQDYAKSLNKSNKAAKDLKGTLAGFDQINLIQQQKDSGGTGGADTSGMFKETSVESMLPTDVSKWMDKLKAAIKAGDWKGVGTVIAQGLNTAVSQLNGWIDKLRPKILKTVQDIVEAVNGFIENFNFRKLGNTLANGFNLAMKVVAKWLKGIKWSDLGKGIGDFINGFVEDWDAAATADVIEAKIGSVLDFLTGIIETTNWNEVSSKLQEMLENIDWESIAEKAWRLLIAALKAKQKIFYGINKGLGQSNEKMDILNDGKHDKIQLGGTVSLETKDDETKNLINWWEKTNADQWKTLRVDTAISQKNSTGDWDKTVEWWKNLKPENEKQIRLNTEGATLSLDNLREEWNSFKEWWENTGIAKWFEEKVQPWLTKEKWAEAGEGMKEGIGEKWEAVVEWWNTLGIVKWFRENVEPWFTKEKWTSAMDGVELAFKDVFKKAINAAISLMNKLINWVNEKMHITIDPLVIGGKTIFAGVDKQLFTLKTIPLLAQGGLAYGDTLARVGEYANAKNNPEVIAPLDKLQSIMGGLNDKDTQTIIALLKRIADKDMEIALYPSAKLGRIVNQSVNMNNIAIGNV